MHFITSLAACGLFIGASPQTSPDTDSSALERPLGRSAVVVEDVVVNVAADAKIGSVRSGLICAPNGDLRWYQLAMPSPDMIREAIIKGLRTNGRTAIDGVRRTAISVGTPANTLRLTIDAASVKICTAWRGIGNAPKGNGKLTMTWHERLPGTNVVRGTTMDEDLIFDRRDPRIDPSIILGAITASTAKYVKSAGNEK